MGFGTKVFTWLLLCIYCFFIYLESLQYVAENVNEVKDRTNDTNINMENGFDKAQGKHIWTTFLVLVDSCSKTLESYDYIGDVTFRNVYIISDRFLLQQSKC